MEVGNGDAKVIFVWKSMPVVLPHFTPKSNSFESNNLSPQKEKSSTAYNANNTNTETIPTSANSNKTDEKWEIRFFPFGSRKNNKNNKEKGQNDLRSKNAFLTNINEEEKMRKTSGGSGGQFVRKSVGSTESNVEKVSLLLPDVHYKKMKHITHLPGNNWKKVLRINRQELEVAFKKDIIQITGLDEEFISDVKFALNNILVATFYLLQEDDAEKMAEIRNGFDKSNYPNTYSFYQSVLKNEILKNKDKN